MSRVKYLDCCLPDNFRQKEIADILKIVSRGESLQLVAPSGSGKSLLIQQLTEKSTKGLAIIGLDFNLLANKTPATALTFFKNRLPISVISPSSSALSAVLIMDHFENILDPSMKDFLNYLKGHYAKSRPCLSYIFASERPIVETNFLSLSGNLSSVLTENIYFLPSLGETDTDWIITTTTAHYQTTLTVEEQDQIYHQSGGYFRIIKYLIKAISNGHKLSDLIRNPNLDTHLGTFMIQVVDKTQNLQGFTLPPIFQNITKSTITLADRSLGEDWPISSNKLPIEDKLNLKQPLTKSEAKIASLLFDNQNTLVSREGTAKAVWGKDAELNYTDHALDQLISRLNKKLSLASPPISITTLRGRGYRLSIPNI